MPKEDHELFELIRNELYVAVICDILDTFGYRNQAMHQRLRPLLPDIVGCGFVGRAKTLRWMNTDYVNDGDPYGLELEAIDSLGPGDVVVHSTDSLAESAPWGELMTTAARRRGAVGCVCDGNIRDCVAIIRMGFPVYCSGIRPVDSRGRSLVMAFDVPVRCGEVLVRPGELIVADYDGIVVVPRDVENDVIRLAHEKVGKENSARADLSAGKALRETYDKFGVL